MPAAAMTKHMSPEEQVSSLATNTWSMAQTNVSILEMRVKQRQRATGRDQRKERSMYNASGSKRENKRWKKMIQTIGTINVQVKLTRQDFRISSPTMSDWESTRCAGTD